MHAGISRLGRGVFIGLLALLPILSGCQTIERQRPGPVSGATSTGDAGAATEAAPPEKSAKKAATAATGDAGVSGVLINFDLTGDTSLIRAGQCRLKLVSKSEDKKEHYVTLRVGETSIFTELPPGVYDGQRLSCSITKIWDLQNLFAQGFVVSPGKVSYVGKVIFEFSKKDLEKYRHANRTENITSLQTALTKLPPALQNGLISGYTGKALNQKTLSRTSPEAFSVFAKGTEDPDRVLGGLLGQLKECGTATLQQDPMRIGQVEYTALYEKGGYVKMISQFTNGQAFSDSFLACMESAIKAFQPPVQNELEVRIRF